jgi:hypothetical protein
MAYDRTYERSEFQPGDDVEVNIAGLRPVTLTGVLLDPEAHEDWHPAVIVDILSDQMFTVQVMPLVGAIEVPPIHISRIRRR